jgi:rod shape determining protein RodA
VVGVPLPLVSQGGTSLVTLLVGFGILMAISADERLVHQ